MPDILVKVPDDPEGAFLRFPEGTDRNTIRMFLGTKRPGQFPLIAEELRVERERRFELTDQLNRQRSIISNPSAAFFKTFGKTSGIVRGLAATVIDPDVAAEELGERTSRFLQNPLTALGAPTAREFVGGAQVKFQELIGGNPPILPFVDTRIFPTAPPPLVDMTTGEFEEERAFAPVDFRRAMRSGLRRSVLGQIGRAATDALLPPEEFGEEFQQLETSGQLERTAEALSEIFGRTPEFAVGGLFGVGAARTVGTRAGAGLVRQQQLNRLGGITGAFAYSNFIDTIVADQIEFGRPGDLSESIDRASDALLSGGKGALTGLALVAGQAGGGALFGRAFGVPASAMSSEAIRVAALGKFLGQLAGGTVAFGTVPPLLEGQRPSIEGYVDAVAILAAFGIGEAVLARQIARHPEQNLSDSVKAVLVEAEQFLLPPPPGRGVPRTRVTPSNIQIEGPRERLLLDVDPRIPEIRQLPAPEPVPTAVAEAPVQRPSAPRAPEGLNEDALRRLEERADADAGGIEELIRSFEGERPPEARVEAPPEPAVAPRQPISEPRAPEPAESTPIEALAERRKAIVAEQSAPENIGPKRELREFQEREDLARIPGLEEQVVEPKQVDALAQLEFDIEGIRRDAKTDAEAMDILVKTMRDIEDVRLEDPQNVREQKFRSIEAASELSGEAMGLRRAEARNLARQVVDAEQVAPGESVVDVIGVSEKDQTIRIRIRTNEGLIETFDAPIEEHFTGVDRFVEADRRANAAIETALAGRTAMMRVDGTVDKIRARLKDELNRLGEEEAGAILNPFGRKKKDAPEGYVPPDIAQVSRFRVMAQLKTITDQLSMLQQALRNPDLTPKDRKTIERRIAVKREEQRIFNQAAQLAPFNPSDPREELKSETFNNLRRIARNMGARIGKNPTKNKVVDAILSRRAQVKGQIDAPGPDFEAASAAVKKFRAEETATVQRYENARTRAADVVLRQVSATHTIMRDVRNLRREHPEAAEIFNTAIIETELIRGGGPAGAHIAHRLQKQFFGGLSRPEFDLLNMMARFRADIALNNADPLIKNTIPTVEAVKAMQNFLRQDRETFLKVNERIDRMQKSFNEVLEFAVDEGVVSREAADRMLAVGEFLPTVLAELSDSAATGISGHRAPTSSPTRRRAGGFEIEDLPDLDKQTTEQLRNLARRVGLRGNLTKIKRDDLEKSIRAAHAQRTARVMDTKLLTTKYFTEFYSAIQRNRAATAIARIATEFPENGIVRLAEQFRNKEGRLEFKKVEATEDIIQYREEGETRGLVVSRQFSDAFGLKTQQLGMDRALPFIGIATGSRITKMFATGFLGPEFAAVAFPRDYFHMRVSTDILGHSTYKSWFPGQGEALIAKDLMTVLPDVILRGKLTQEYIENGGAMDFLAQASLFQKGEHVTDSLRARMTRLQMARTDSRLLNYLQDVSFKRAGDAERFYHALQYTNTTAELTSRVAEVLRRKKQIAKEKGIAIEDLEPSDIRAAVFSARSRIDFADGGNLLRLAEEFAPYARASVQALRAPGRTAKGIPESVNRIRSGKGSKEDFKTLANAGTLFASLLGFPMMLYFINKHNNEQGLMDLPSFAKGDLVFVLPEGLGGFDDENDIPRQAYVRLPVDQSLYVFNALGYNLAAMALGDIDNVDIESIELAARRILTLPGTSSMPLHMKIIVEQFTNKSTIMKGMKLFRGDEGGIPGAEVEAGETSPALIRLGELFPGLSPERMQASINGSLPDRFTKDGLGLLLNKTLGAGIEDVRLDEEGLFLQRMPGVDQILKDFASGGSAIANGYEVSKKVIGAKNMIRSTIDRNMLASRNRNDGELVLDVQLRLELGTILEAEENAFARGIVERTIDFEKVNALSSFPRIWRGIIREPAGIASVKFYAALLGLTEENRVALQLEMRTIKRSKVKSKFWWRDFIREVKGFEPEWRLMVEQGKTRDVIDRGLERLEERGLLGPIPRESVFSPPGQ